MGPGSAKNSLWGGLDIIEKTWFLPGMDKRYQVSCVWCSNIRQVWKTSLICKANITNLVQLAHSKQKPCFILVITHWKSIIYYRVLRKRWAVFLQFLLSLIYKLECGDISSVQLLSEFQVGILIIYPIWECSPATLILYSFVFELVETILARLQIPQCWIWYCCVIGQFDGDIISASTMSPACSDKHHVVV